LNAWIRRIHRWVSLLFILTVIATTVALSQKEPMIWMSYVPLFPLALLALSGLYMLVVHYSAKWRGKRGASA
jgi:hypothetical protein